MYKFGDHYSLPTRQLPLDQILKTNASLQQAQFPFSKVFGTLDHSRAQNGAVVPTLFKSVCFEARTN